MKMCFYSVDGFTHTSSVLLLASEWPPTQEIPQHKHHTVKNTIRHLHSYPQLTF